VPDGNVLIKLLIAAAVRYTGAVVGSGGMRVSFRIPL
jgi:hypothetical protein